MKYLIIINFILFLGPITSFGQWEVKHLSNDFSIDKIRFWDDSLGLALGSIVVLKTEDLGESWRRIETDLDIDFVDFQFISKDTVYAISSHVFDGNSGDATFIISTDAGENWEAISRIPDKQFLSLHFLNSKVGFVSGFDGIWKTEDNGNSWNMIFSVPDQGFKFGEISQIQFLNDSVGFASLHALDDNSTPSRLVSLLLKTEDGGAEWNQVIEFEDISRFDFHNDSIGFLSGYSKIFRTDDGGVSWNLVYEMATTGQIYDIQFLSDEKIVMAGHPGAFFEGTSFTFLKTTDGGETFSGLDTIGIPLRTVYFLNDSVGFVAGWNGLIMKTSTCGGEIVGNYPWPQSSTNDIFDKFEIEVFPNPINEHINVRFFDTNQKNLRFKIVSIFGSTIQSGKLEDSKIEINDLSSGFYFLYIQDDNGNSGVKKIEIIR